MALSLDLDLEEDALPTVLTPSAASLRGSALRQSVRFDEEDLKRRMRTSVTLRSSKLSDCGQRHALRTSLRESQQGYPIRMSLRAFNTAVATGFDELSRIQSASEDETPYWQQGDEELDTPEMIEQRRALRRHPKVLEAIEVWWSTAQRTQNGGASDDKLAREKYIPMSKKASVWW